jgi:serine/threonine-protein kinase
MTDDSLVGQTFAGKYRVETLLGKGGMGLVLGARHIKLDEPVAIKVLRSTMLEVPGMATRFLREARAACKIKSLYVVRVTDVDILEDGIPYMVMEYLEGTDLLGLRRQAHTFGIAEAVGYILEACDAIAEAHSLGIVHRDLKPSNLFLHRYKDGRTAIKVLDFGISKVEAPDEQETTKSGQMMGSPKYMSPEQMRSMSDVDGRSDIWSLGVILYELLTGQAPFLADTTARVCALVLHSAPVPPSTLRPEIPPGLERAIMRCLEKDPDRRFATVAELMDALAPFSPHPLSLDASKTTSPAFGPEGSPAIPAPPSSRSPLHPSATPPPASWDAQADLEVARFRGGSPRLAALLLGAAVLVGLGALYVAEREPAASVAPPSSAIPAETARVAQGAPTSAPSSEPAPKAYSLSDLPDVRRTADRPSTGAPASKPSASSSSELPPTPPVKPPRPAPPSADPFGGRRN